MNTISRTSQALLIAVLLSAVAAGGCSRRQPAAEGQASSGSSATDTTTASRASGSSDTGTSSGTSGTSGTSGASGSPSAAESSGTSGSTSGGTGSKAGAAIDDSVITTKIKSSILADSAIKGSDVSVETKGGEVTLTGSVKTQAQMDRVQKLAQNTDGVKGVQNKLAVKP